MIHQAPTYNHPLYLLGELAEVKLFIHHTLIMTLNFKYNAYSANQIKVFFLTEFLLSF